LLVAAGDARAIPRDARSWSACHRFMPAGEPVDGAFLLRRVDLCHLAFWLGLGAHFLDDDPRLSPLGEAVLAATAAAGVKSQET
jgi:hypothetical protein